MNRPGRDEVESQLRVKKISFPLMMMQRRDKCFLFSTILLLGTVALYLEMIGTEAWDDCTGKFVVMTLTELRQVLLNLRKYSPSYGKWGCKKARIKHTEGICYQNRPTALEHHADGIWQTRVSSFLWIKASNVLLSYLWIFQSSKLYRCLKGT